MGICRIFQWPACGLNLDPRGAGLRGSQGSLRNEEAGVAGGHISTCAIHAGARRWEGAKTRDDTLIEIRLPSPTTLAPKGAWSANGPGVLADGSVSGERS